MPTHKVNVRLDAPRALSKRQRVVLFSDLVGKGKEPDIKPDFFSKLRYSRKKEFVNAARRDTQGTNTFPRSHRFASRFAMIRSLLRESMGAREAWLVASKRLMSPHMVGDSHEVRQLRILKKVSDKIAKEKLSRAQVGLRLLYGRMQHPIKKNMHESIAKLQTELSLLEKDKATERKSSLLARQQKVLIRIIELEKALADIKYVQSQK